MTTDLEAKGFGDLRRNSHNDTRRESAGRQRTSLPDSMDKRSEIPGAQQRGAGEPSGDILRKRVHRSKVMPGDTWEDGRDNAHSQPPASPQPKAFPSQRGSGLSLGENSRRVATEEAAGSKSSSSDAKASEGVASGLQGRLEEKTDRLADRNVERGLDL